LPSCPIALFYGSNKRFLDTELKPNQKLPHLNLPS
jgi:hypothetical protein